MTGLAAIIRCSDVLHTVIPTVTNVRQQSLSAGVVLVTSTETAESVRQWLSAFAGVEGMIYLEVAGNAPGASWNGGIAAAGSELCVCLDAGDGLDGSFFDRASELLATETVGAVLSTLLELGPGPRRREVPAPLLLDDLLSSIHYSRRPLVVRQSIWSELGGFDESFETLEDFDFLVRLLASGATIGRIPEALSVRARRYDGLYRHEWERRGEAMRRWLIKPESHMIIHSDVVDRRRKSVDRLRDKHREWQKRSDAASAEIVRLREVTTSRPPDGGLDFDGRVTPVSLYWGSDRGNPVDRYYIERFLEQNSSDIRGVVLEVDNPDYTLRFGGNHVTRSEVVDVVPANTQATIITDLRRAANIPSNSFDCIILTQTLQFVDDMPAVIGECERLLVPGGVLLATLPTSSRICLEYGYNGDFWRVTGAGARQLFGQSFPQAALDVQEVGNVFAIAAFTYGLAEDEAGAVRLAQNDPFHPLVVTVRAVKPDPNRGGPMTRAPAYVSGRQPSAAILLYHRLATLRTDTHAMAVSELDFQHQMEVIASKFRALSVADFREALLTRDIPERSVVVTFDDGYRDNLDAASPILTELGVPAMFFITTGDLESPPNFWWDSLEWSLLESEGGASVHIEFTGESAEFDLATPAHRREAHEALYPRMQAASHRQQARVLEELEAVHEGKRSLGRLRMNAEELRELARRPGHSIGAHTARHLLLPKHPLMVQQADIQASKTTLEGILGNPVDFFAYPFGAFDEATVRLVEDAGFDLAFTCEWLAASPSTNRFRLPRLEVTRRGQQDFAAWLESSLEIVPG